MNYSALTEVWCQVGCKSKQLLMYSRSGMTREQAGPVEGGHSVSVSSDVGVDSSGNGFYDQKVHVI